MKRPSRRPAAGGGSLFDNLLPLLPILFILFYLVVLRPARRQEQERENMLKSLKKNDRILTHAGIFGTVVSVSETEDEMTVKVDDNVRLKMVKSMVSRNLTNEEAAKEAKEKEAKEKAAKDGKPAETAITTTPENADKVQVKK
jgi:preprotein translocase subunit YajC